MKLHSGMMDFLEKIKKWVFEPDPDPDPDEQTEKETEEDDIKQQTPKNADALIVLVKPAHHSEAESICRNIIDGKAVLLDIGKMTDLDKQRFLDFLSGVALSEEGTIIRISHDIFVCVPKNIGITEEKEEP